MSQNTAPPRRQNTGSGAAWSSGGTLFAGVLMLVIGIMDILQGIAAIAEDDVYTRVGDYVFKFDLTSWGWIHLILGIVVAISGYGILKGSEWGRAAGITLAALNTIAQFLFLPYHPWWALFSMAISIFVIWALATDDDLGKGAYPDPKAPRGPGTPGTPGTGTGTPGTGTPGTGTPGTGTGTPGTGTPGTGTQGPGAPGTGTRGPGAV